MPFFEIRGGIMKPIRIFVLGVALFLIALSGGCKLPTQQMSGQIPQATGSATVEATSVLSDPSAVVIPTQDQLPTATLVLPTVTPDKQTPTAADKAPSAKPTATLKAPTAVPTNSTPTASKATPTPAKPTASPTPVSLPITVQGSYAVVLVDEGSVLNPHKLPAAASEISGKLAYNEKNLNLTGKTSGSGSSAWVELNLPGGGTGWVSRASLTELVSSQVFCGDSKVDQLITAFITALKVKDGNAFSRQVSPVHGLTVQPVHGGTPVTYDAQHAAWVLESTYVVNWGRGPASGLPVLGSFGDVVTPGLIDILGSQYTKTCNTVSAGGASYTIAWPKIYENVNYVSMYRAAPAGKEQDWRTWLLGIEYVGGQPYLFSLSQYTWEP
jgi:hypothetical protein